MPISSSISSRGLVAKLASDWTGGGRTVDASEIRRSPVDMVNICKYPNISRVLYNSTGAGFLPSTVLLVVQVEVVVASVVAAE